MTKPERQLRMVQLAYVLFLVLCILLVYFGVLGDREPTSTINVTQALVVLLALWSGVSGFTLQRRLRLRTQRTSTKSTLFTRWKVGHVFRLCSAMAVGLWGLVLYEIRGPLWIDDVLFAVALILLLVWRPGASPEPE
jgi:hypothetical protein